jgi:hypothetical protein
LAFAPAIEKAAATAAKAIPRFMVPSLQALATVDYPPPRS